MADNYIQISKINDFLFCPKSLYFHSIYENFQEKNYHCVYQTRGKLSHQTIDQKKYSTSKHILQGINIFSNKYNLCGKIDIYDKKTKTLIERKYLVKRIYKGYLYQLYAQMLCLNEMGYIVKKLKIHSLKNNKNYFIPLPNNKNLVEFKKTLTEMQNFKITNFLKPINKNKCKKCIYSSLCF
jgi:CRISPR-associated protein Cas4